MTGKLYTIIARKVQARLNCAKTGNTEWFDRHEDAIKVLVKRHLPSGSGFDSGTEIDLYRSQPNRLTFTTSFHHMNEAGFYDGWTEHGIIVTPDLANGFDLRVTGRDRNDIKDYIADVFLSALSSDVEEYPKENAA